MCGGGGALVRACVHLSRMSERKSWLRTVVDSLLPPASPAASTASGPPQAPGSGLRGSSEVSAWGIGDEADPAAPQVCGAWGE